jgi:hypothetical protein
MDQSAAAMECLMPKKATRVVSDTWIQIIAKVPGFISYYWVNAGNGVRISTSVFRFTARC